MDSNSSDLTESGRKDRKGASHAISAENTSSGSAKLTRASKSAMIVEALQSPGGTSIANLCASTGWQSHSVRAALTGLKKKGHVIIRTRVGDQSIYAISPTSVAASNVPAPASGSSAEPTADEEAAGSITDVASNASDPTTKTRAIGRRSSSKTAKSKGPDAKAPEASRKRSARSAAKTRGKK
ncbi:DUF3489 domain-containing protein [Cucumibacter marinus]|uniref:DUF3489 domain-containing protein n=1 Tax=Cucumibacter marinus TaxID=1121252 RepID=UPI0006861F05|nr:DUF3489 domain-containing protein [Cucumibacter marinus]